jgi:hypothetical protein
MYYLEVKRKEMMGWVRSRLGVRQTPNLPETTMYKAFEGSQVRRLGVFSKSL